MIRILKKYFFLQLAFWLSLDLLSNTLLAQQNKVDSLENLLKNTRQDTTRLRLRLELCRVCNIKDNLKYAGPTVQLADSILARITNEKERKNILKQKGDALYFFNYYYEYTGDSAKSIENRRKRIAIYEKIKDTSLLVNSILDLGAYFSSIGNFPKALENCQTSLAIAQQANDKKGITFSLLSIGNLYYNQGDTAEALKNCQKYLSLFTELKDTSNLSDALIFSGSLYGELHDTAKALSCFKKGISLYEKMKRSDNVLWAYNSIGVMFESNGDFKNALRNYQQAYSMAEKTNNRYWMATLLNEIGTVYLRMNLVSTALDYYNRALAISEESKDEYCRAMSYTGLALVYQKQKKFSRANYFIGKTLLLRKKQNDVAKIRDAEQLAAQIDSAMGNFKEAYAHYQQYILLRDKMKSDAIRKAAIRENFQREYEKRKDDEKVKQDKKDAIADEEKRKQKLVIWSVVAILLLVVVFAGFIFRSLQITRKQKAIIEIQKDEVEKTKFELEERNKDITDSIQYAKRIQQSLMPTEKYMDRNITRLKKE